MAANENRPKELSASFRVVHGSVVLTEEPAKTTPYLEMESSPGPSTALHDTGASKENRSFRGSSSGRVIVSPDEDPEPQKSVRFAPPEEGGVVVRRDDIVPAVTDEERSRLYYSKDEKKNMKSSIKHAVVYFRSGSNSLFLPPSASASPPIMTRMVFSQSTDGAVFVGDEERTRIGLETSILPQIKLESRRKMARLVAKHRGWKLQHPAYFDEDFLAQNCRAVSSSSREWAVERARAVVDELKREATPSEERRGASCRGPTEGATAGAATSTTTTGAASATGGEGRGEADGSFSEAATAKNDPVEPFFCSVETIFDASTGNTNLSVPSTGATAPCAATITVEAIRMEAPSNACMVR